MASFPRKHWFLILMALSLVGIALITLSSRNPISEPVKLRLGIATWPGFASAMIGQEKGFFPGLKIENVVLDDPSARHAAFQGGQIDIMVSSADVFAQEVAQGIKGEIILVTDESFGGDGIVAKTGITSAAGLRGEKIAFARATPSQYFLYRYLAKSGMSLSDVNQVIVQDPGNAGQAFLGGSVDAAVTFEPFLSQVASSSKGHVLVTRD